MCGRFVSPSVAEAERNFTIDLLLAQWEPSYNLAPTDQAPVIRLRGEQHVCEPMRFGMIPFFARGVAPSFSTINATVEKLESNASWRSPWARRQRCLVLTNGFYEWHVLPDGKTRQPYFVKPADQETFALAGLWDLSKADDGTATHSFAIITLPASPLMAEIHNAKKREPAILVRADCEVWLNGTAEQAKAALRQYPDDLLTAYPVSTRVGSPKNNDEKLIDRTPSA